METITKIGEIQKISSYLKLKKQSVGFVPTMGFLHDGHISLIKKSNELCDKTIVSIFVNPTQFGPDEDLEEYPRDIDKDIKILTGNEVDYLFLPSGEEIYPDDFQTFVNTEKISLKLEGEFRQTHFRGVTTIVNILFNCVNPDYAFFGQKDAQQAAVIKQMVSDLKIPVNIVVCPIIRESDGLAMSSRNIYLSGNEREDALILSKSIQVAKSKIENGERNVKKIISKMSTLINKVASSDLEYINIVTSDTFEFVETLNEGTEYYILIACRIGNTRLIDNELIKIN